MRPNHFMKRYGIPMALIVGAIALLLVTIIRAPALAVHSSSTADMTTLLGSNAHTGYNASETAINPSNVSSLSVQWIDQAAGHMTDQVLSSNGTLYWASWDGMVHATNPKTGHDLWTTNVGTKPGSCGQNFGVVGTGTIATVQMNGVSTSVLYIAGGQDNLNAIDTSTGKILWQTNLGNNDPAEFIYASTTYYNGSIYIGTASFGDCPVVQGQIYRVDASSGQIQNSFNVVPNGCIGAGVWGSISVDEATGKLYFGAGNSYRGSCPGNEPLGQSIVELNASDLTMVASWPVPASDASVDDDYGSTPTLYQATINGVSRDMLGIVNKNGYYYALDRTNIAAGSIWKTRISVGGTDPYSKGSIPTTAYDGTNLYAAGGLTTIQGQQCAGSLQALDAATGAVKWQLCLGAAVVAPTVAVPGLVVVEWGSNVSVVNSATGTVLYNYLDTTAKSYFEGAATISNGVLYVGSRDGKVYAFSTSNNPPPTPPPGTVLAQDTFQRANQSLWGTASDGHTWSGDANRAAGFSINANVGQITTSTTHSYNALLGQTAANAEVLFSGSVSTFATTGNSLGAVLRWSDSKDYYKAYIDGTHLGIQKKVGGTITRIASTKFTATAGTQYNIRFNIVGTTLSVKAWQVGTTEPTGWMVTATDTAFTSGFCGLNASLQSGSTASITSFEVTAQ